MTVNERLIISLYDYTGVWPSYYIKAGYPVILWDKQIEGDIISDDFFNAISGYHDFVYGILSATPCTHFAGSGARWWPFISPKDLDTSIALAQMVLVIKNWFSNLKFWALENPVGRLEKLIPEFKPYRKFSFDPCDYGDPYPKKTIIWGECNVPLKTPVLPLYKDYIHHMSPGPERRNLRSATPKGFAKAFFEANR